MKKLDSNFFSFVTKETTMSAFFAYLLAYKKDCDLNLIQERFYKLLEIEKKDVKEVKTEQTFVDKDKVNNKIRFDIQIEKKDGNFLIIENKMYDDALEQIEKYKSIVKEKQMENKYLFAIITLSHKGIYWKKHLKKQIIFINYKDISDILASYEGKNTIINEYRECLKKWISEEEEIQKNFINKLFDDDNDDKKDIGKYQWYFMEELFENVNYEGDFEKNDFKLYNGKNIGKNGEPWTEFCIYRKKINKDYTESIFFRLQRYKEGYKLSIRQYKDNKNILEASKNRYSKLLQYMKDKNYFQKSKKEYINAKESEFAYIYLSKDDSSIGDLLKTEKFDEFKKFIKDFVENFILDINQIFDI